MINSFVNSPCIFCGYEGRDFFEAGTHLDTCPWFHIPGKANREKICFTISMRLVGDIKEELDKMLGCY